MLCIPAPVTVASPDVYQRGSKRWLRYDDATVTPTDEGSVLRGRERECYLLVYTHAPLMAYATAG